VPRGDAERAIAAAFEVLLGVAPVGAHDDFFEAGGSSLAAVSLLAEVEARTGVALEIGALARGATVAALARALAAERSASVLVDLGGTPGAATWVLVHPIGGTLLGYLELARRLGVGGRVLGLRAPGLEPGETALGSVEALAEHYVANLGEVAGPLWLVGWSFGGLVASELARRLQPERLAGLALLDAALPDATRPLPPAGDPRLLAWFWRDLAGIGGRHAPVPTSAALEGLDEGAQGERLAVLAEEAGLVRGRGGRERLLRLLHVFEAHAGALARYRPAALELAAPVWLARADEGPAGAPEPEVGWRALLGRAPELLRLPGNHYTLLQNPLVTTLAERLVAFAAEAAPANPPTLAAAAAG
jgi:thioesterase domain-containing protein/acyl carrier protein